MSLDHSPDYWLGRLSLVAAAALKRLPHEPKVAREIVRRELRDFERSPVASEPLREMLREEMKR